MEMSRAPFAEPTVVGEGASELRASLNREKRRRGRGLNRGRGGRRFARRRRRCERWGPGFPVRGGGGGKGKRGGRGVGGGGEGRKRAEGFQVARGVWGSGGSRG